MVVQWLGPELSLLSLWVHPWLRNWDLASLARGQKEKKIKSLITFAFGNCQKTCFLKLVKTRTIKEVKLLDIAGMY